MLLNYWLDIRYFLCHNTNVIILITYTLPLEVKQMSNLQVRSNSIPASIKADKENWMTTVLIALYTAQAALTVNQLCKIVSKQQKDIDIALGYFNSQNLIVVKGNRYKIAKSVTAEDIKVHGFLVK
jgi:hypothetical protein